MYASHCVLVAVFVAVGSSAPARGSRCATSIVAAGDASDSTSASSCREDPQQLLVITTVAETGALANRLLTELALIVDDLEVIAAPEVPAEVEAAERLLTPSVRAVVWVDGGGSGASLSVLVADGGRVLLHSEELTPSRMIVTRLALTVRQLVSAPLLLSEEWRARPSAAPIAPASDASALPLSSAAAPATQGEWQAELLLSGSGDLAAPGVGPALGGELGLRREWATLRLGAAFRMTVRRERPSSSASVSGWSAMPFLSCSVPFALGRLELAPGLEAGLAHSRFTVREDGSGAQVRGAHTTAHVGGQVEVRWPRDRRWWFSGHSTILYTSPQLQVRRRSDEGVLWRTPSFEWSTGFGVGVALESQSGS